MNVNQENATIPLSDFEDLCAQLFAQREVVEKLSGELDDEKAAFKELESKILFIMEETEKEKHHVAGRGLIYTQNYFNVAMPKDEDNRSKLFEYLDKKGIREQMLTIHSQTLNSFYKQEMAAAIESGDITFKVPGLEEPKHTKQLRLRKG